MEKFYAYPYDTIDGFPFEATHWYAQLGDQWMAVVGEWEPEDMWFDEGADDDVVWPDPRIIPINERPSGTLVFRDETGTEHIWAG